MEDDKVMTILYSVVFVLFFSTPCLDLLKVECLSTGPEVREVHLVTILYNDMQLTS